MKLSKNNISLDQIKKDSAFILLSFGIMAFLLLLKLKIYGNLIPDWDEAHHLKMGYYFYRALSEQNWLWVRDLLTFAGGIYPPLYHILIALITFLFGITTSAGLYVNIPFILILMFSIYGLGFELGNRKAGLLAAVLTPILPVFLTLQERATIDYMSISLFVLSFFLTFKTNGLTNRKYSVLLGIVLLLELLTKWPFAVPSIPLLIYVITSYIKQKGKRDGTNLNWLIVASIIMPGIYWYAFNFQIITSGLSFFWNPNSFAQQIWANPQGFTFNNLILYIFTFPSQASGVGTVVLAFFIGCLFVKIKNPKFIYLYASIFITYIVLTVLDDKSTFYIAYAYPLLMLITFNILLNIKNLIPKVVLVSILSGSIVVNFLLSQNANSEFKEVTLNSFNLNLAPMPGYTSKFTKEVWPTPEFFKGTISKKTCPNGVLTFPDNRFLNYPNIDYYLAVNLIDIKRDPAYRYYNPATDNVFNIGYLNLYDCFITKSGYPGIFANEAVVNQVIEYLSRNNEYSISTYRLQDGSEIQIYRRKTIKLPTA